MFGKFIVNTCLMTVILLSMGCGVFSSVESGVEPTEVLILDGGYEFAETIEKGEILALDMREPVKSGYEIIGASFDPAVLNLVQFLNIQSEKGPRVQYMFKAMADGMTDVLIKMKPTSGGDAEVYKRISVNVGNDDRLF